MAANFSELAQIGKRESAAVLSNAYLNRKDFRVFFGLIETSEDAKSPAHGLERHRSLPSHLKPNMMIKNESEEEKGTSSP